MFQESDYQLLRQARAARHDELRRAAYVARVQRFARAERRLQRRRRRAERARRSPHLVAPPPALAE